MSPTPSVDPQLSIGSRERVEELHVPSSLDTPVLDPHEEHRTGLCVPPVMTCAPPTLFWGPLNQLPVGSREGAVGTVWGQCGGLCGHPCAESPWGQWGIVCPPHALPRVAVAIGEQGGGSWGYLQAWESGG